MMDSKYNLAACGLLLGILFCMGAGPARPASAGSKEVAGVKPMLAEQIAALEREIAARMTRRSDTPAEKLPRLEMEIDLRITARWMLLQAQAASVASDAQASCRLRAQLCLEAAGALEEVVDRQGGKLTAAQTGAMASLHQTTFALTEGKTTGEIDKICQAIGAAVHLIGTGAEAKAVLMRPRPMRGNSATPAPAAGAAAAAGARLTPIEEARRLNVSPALRQELIAMATAAQAGGDAKDRGAMAQALGEALDLARGLGSNTAVSVEGRLQLDGQLTEALALYMDPRTRPAGQARLSAMQQYRQMVTRIGGMKLTTEQANQFGPLFTWARENPEQQMKVMAAVERFLQARARFEARQKQGSMMPALKRAVEDLERQWPTACAVFMSGAAELPKATAMRVTDLEARADEVKRIVDVLEVLDHIPPALDKLAPFKPRPTGGLEKRVVQAAMSAASSTSSPARNDGARALGEVIQLAAIVSQMPSMSSTSLPAGFEKNWAGGKLAAVDARWREHVSDIASVIAGGGEPDAKRLAKVTAARTLYEALQQGVNMDILLAGGGEAIGRWADWRLTVDDLKPLLRPYPQAMADAFAGYAADSFDAEVKWAQAAKQYRPLIGHIAKLTAYREQCGAMPTGIAGIASALMTPFDGAPYATERSLNLLVHAWRWNTANDAASAAAEEILAAMSKRVSE